MAGHRISVAGGRFAHAPRSASARADGQAAAERRAAPTEVTAVADGSFTLHRRAVPAATAAGRKAADRAAGVAGAQGNPARCRIDA